MHFSHLSPLDALVAVVFEGLHLAAGIAAVRRSRCLSGYPWWRSLAIGVLAYWFVLLWLISWAINSSRIASEWEAYHAARRASTPEDEAAQHVSS